MTTSKPIAIILAAGKGSRMGSDRPKVLFEAAGKPLVRWVIDALDEAGVVDKIVVVGYQAEMVQEKLSGLPNLVFAMQQVQRGTGDAVRSAAAALVGRTGPVVIVTGDSPMLRCESVRAILEHLEHTQAACVIGTTFSKNPAGLGRIVRNADGSFQKIIEERDADAEEKRLTEVNMSTYAFRVEDLLFAIDKLTNANAAGEYYLTDCPLLLLEAGKHVEALACLDESEALSVNTLEQLANVDAALTAVRRKI